MATRLATPGVYVQEKSAFSSSVVAVATAVPAFIGYTEKATRGKNSLTNVPTKVSSLTQYARLFGGAPQTTYTVTPEGDTGFSITPKDTVYYMYNSLRLFFANGGGSCYIVSLGSYSDKIDKDTISAGIERLLTQQEPTMVLTPDALSLEEAECYEVYKQVLAHCGDATKSRVGVFDVYNGAEERTYDKNDVVTRFREGIGNNSLAYGASYYPWVRSTVVSRNDVGLHNIANVDTLKDILYKEAQINYLGQVLSAPKAATPKEGEEGKPKRKAPAKSSIPASVDAKSRNKYEAVKAEIDKIEGNDENVFALSDVYKDILKAIHKDMNILPPSGAIAGVYAFVDKSVGVHKAPANVSLNGIIAPTVDLTNDDQEDLNTPINGKAVNAVRGFINKGVLVWGARTLNGNSQDWKYINVRRTMIMLEQSIKNAVEAYVFEPNTPQTWLKVRTSIDNFLTSMWKQGTLVGNSTTEAYSVNIGLDSTMTPVDILEGIMRIDVQVAISRPAEFIVITFSQKMQGAVDAAAESEE